MLSRLLLVRRIVAARFGVRLRPLLTFVAIVAHRAVLTVGWALDPLVFPGLARAQVRPPLVIVGNPRSGTTFLHRWLVRHGFGAGFQLWQLLWPTLLPRAVVRPLLGLLERVSPARFHGTAAHPTSLTSVETDDALLFFRFLDGLFGWGYFLAWDDADHDDELGSTLRAHTARDLAFLAEAQRRNAWWSGKDRAVAKLFSVALRPEQALAAWPDARFVYLVRDPVEVIPSGMSLLMGVLGRAYPLERATPEARARYVERLYRASLALYRGMADAQRAGRLPPERVLVVRYDRLMADFEGELARIAAFAGHPLDDALRDAARATAASQRAWESGHRYRAEDFGLDPARIVEDAGFVYETWGIPRPTLRG